MTLPMEPPGNDASQGNPEGVLAPRLVERTGPHAGREHPLGPGRHVLGRERGAQVPLEGPDVSRRHARIEVGEAGVRIADLESKNGVVVDGLPVPDGGSVSVGHGARIELGGVELELVHPVGAVDRALREAGEVTVTHRRARAPDTEAAAPRGLLVPVLGVALFGIAALLLWWFG